MPRTDFRKVNYDIKLTPSIDVEKDVKYGESFEEIISQIFEKDVDRNLEVKTERDIWKTTKNIAVEFRCRNKLSGISTTNANYWVHVLADSGKMVGAFIFPVDVLKKKMRKMYDNKEAFVKPAGDNKESRVLCMPIRKLFT